MSRKPSLLASALNTAETETDPTPILPRKEMKVGIPSEHGQHDNRPRGSYVPPSRSNKSARTHHLPKPYWETLEEISFRTRDEKGRRVPQERLMAEALNLLFMKYNYPQVSNE